MLDTIYQSIIEGNALKVTEGIQQALEAGHDPGQILDQGMIAPMTEVGRRFEPEACFVLEMLIAARAMQQGTDILYAPDASSAANRAKALLGV